MIEDLNVPTSVRVVPRKHILQDFIVILKRTLQNCYEILKNCLPVIASGVMKINVKTLSLLVSKYNIILLKKIGLYSHSHDTLYERHACNVLIEMSKINNVHRFLSR